MKNDTKSTAQKYFIALSWDANRVATALKQTTS